MNISRPSAKRINVIRATLVVGLLTSCAGPLQQRALTTLETVSRSIDATSEIATPLWVEKCSGIATACKEAGDTECSKLVKCHHDWNRFADYVSKGRAAVLAALSVLK